MKRIVLLALACTPLLACQDHRSMTGVKPPSALLLDGANNHGNKHFFFLPPLVSQPSFSGVFNPTLKPVVVICELDVSTTPAACSGAPAIAPGPVTVDLAGQLYKVNWDTRQSGISVDKFYRIQVFGSPNGLLLGSADVDPVSNGSQLKNLTTGDFIGLVDGRTLPIKFRIERGAFTSGGDCTDCVEQGFTNAGGTAVTNTGFAGVQLPSPWLTQDFIARNGGSDQVTVIIERLTVSDADPDLTKRCVQLNQPQFQGCYRFRTDPFAGPFATNVTVGVCLELPESDPRHTRLQLFSQEEGSEPTITALENVAAPFVSCANFASASSNRVVNFARASWKAFVRHVGPWFSPPSLFAAHVGAGGLTGSFSRIGWVLPLADLRVESLSHAPTSPTGADPITYTAVVRNIGGMTAPASSVGFLVGHDPTFQVVGIGSLGPGASTTASVTLSPRAPGVYADTARADVNGDVIESNETNNDFTTAPYTVGAGNALYAVDAHVDGLYVLNATTGQVTFSFGPLGGSNPGLFTTPVAMGVRPSDGGLFVWNNSPTGGLVRVDKCSGLGTAVSTSDQGDLGALAFAPNGELLGLSGALYAINPSSGVKTLLGGFGIAGLNIAAADINAGGALYGVELSLTTERLVTIDTSIGTATVVGTLNQAGVAVDVGTIGSIVFNGTTLIGTAFSSPISTPAGGAILFDIDPATAAISNVRTITGPGTFVPQGLGFAPGCVPPTPSP